MNFLKKASGVSKRVTWGTALNVTDRWYHIVAYNEDNVEIGLSVDAGTHVVLATETGMDDNALPIAFGSSSDGAAASAVAGIMDEIALHSKALSADEVTDLYNGTDGKAYPYIPNFMAPSFVSGFLTFVEMNRGVEESDTTVPEDTENITAWRDQYSGNDIDFVQDTSSNQPVYDTDHFGLAGVVFDGTDDFISHTTSSVANFERTDDFYLIVAFKTPASFGTGFQALFSHQINSGTYAGWLLHHVDKTTRMQMRYNASNDVNVAGGTALSNDTFYIVEVKYTGAAIPTASNIQIYLNGVAETLTDNSVGTVNGTTQSIGEAMIGARGIDGVSTTGYSACIIAAAGCYAQLPTDAERIKLRSYLLNKYGGQ